MVSPSTLGHDLAYRLAKRTFDLALAVSLCLVLSPVMFAIALVVKLDSPGTILYRGERVGLHCRRFHILKFRTMVQNAEAMGTTTALGDPRITRVGHFLRRCKLDELPQLFNVLAGTMSFVGPRPEVAEHTDAYTEQERAILEVKPGITDYASIRFVSLDEILGAQNAHERFVTVFRAEKNQLRLDYVRRRSFGEDLRILWLTVLAVFRKVTRPKGTI